MSMDRRKLMRASAALAISRVLSTSSPAESEEFRPVLRQGEPPLGEFVSDDELPNYTVDVEASQERRQLVLSESGRTIDTIGPTGAIINIPDADFSEVGIDGYFEDDAPFNSGGRIILRGISKSLRPKFHHISLEHRRRFDAPVSLEIENVDFSRKSGVAPTVDVKFFRYVSLDNVNIRGGRYGLYIPVGPTILKLNEVDVSRTNTGDSQAHLCAINYIEKATIENSVFTSPQAEAHCIKCFAAEFSIRDSIFAHYWDGDDLQQGLHGRLPLIDSGAWCQTTLVGNQFYRRGRDAAPDFISLRNWVKLKGSLKFAPYWGVDVVDYHEVDNTDEDNPHLFRHLIASNTFYNGISPDSKESDEEAPQRAAYGIRNNGTCPTYAKGLESYLCPSSDKLEQILI